ncbi:MAG TPA: EAL domain-containing protein [Geminicoccaceae bacterium]
MATALSPLLYKHDLSLGLVPKLTCTMALLLLSFAVAQTWLNILAQQHTIESQIVKRARTTALAVASLAAQRTGEGHQRALEHLLDDLGGQESLTYLAVIDWDGSLIVGRAPGPAELPGLVDDPLSREARNEGRSGTRLDAGVLHLAVPVDFPTNQRGAVQIGMSTAGMTSEVAGMRRRNIVLIIVFLAGAVVVAFALARRITQPLTDLIETTEAVADGRFDGRVSVRTRDELELLAQAFNRMLDRLDATTVSRDYLTHILHSMAEGLVVLSADGRITLANRAMARLTQYRESELKGMLYDRLLSSGDPRFGAASDLIGSVQRDGSVEGIEGHYRARDGQAIAVLISGTIFKHAGAASSGMICIAQDDRERRRQQEKVRRLAYFDSVTGLANRSQFEAALDRALAHARQLDHKLAVLFLDLDQFKRINDTLGHAVGDLLLKGFAGRLVRCLRGSDLVAAPAPHIASLARLGGDEFTILLSRIHDENEPVTVARRILDAMREPFQLDRHEVVIDASIGIAIYPDDSADQETLLMHADAAMYQAKAEARGTFRVFGPQDEAEALDRLALERDLRCALDHEQLFLAFQPQLDLATDRVVGAEALLRWAHPQRGIIPPDAFIPLIEETGLIQPVGQWVLRAGCAEARRWLKRPGGPLRISVNISPRQLRAPDFVASVRAVLDEAGLPAELLELEITEGAAMSDPEAVAVKLRELAAMGVQLAIDDFGTGHSSLTYLKLFPLDRIKIDRSFIRDLVHDGRDAEIVNAIIAMAHQLRFRVIAEGVERNEQLLMLREKACDEIQGYLLSRPLASAEFADWLNAEVNASPRLRPDFRPWTRAPRPADQSSSTSSRGGSGGL